MNIEFSKRFEKQLNTISDKKLIAAISSAVKEVQQAKSLSVVTNIKKLKGSKNAFRIRVGDYRLGIFLLDDTVLFAAIMHRKEIYKYFP